MSRRESDAAGTEAGEEAEGELGMPGMCDWDDTMLERMTKVARKRAAEAAEAEKGGSFNRASGLVSRAQHDQLWNAAKSARATWLAFQLERYRRALDGSRGDAQRVDALCRVGGFISEIRALDPGGLGPYLDSIEAILDQGKRASDFAAPVRRAGQHPDLAPEVGS